MVVHCTRMCHNFFFLLFAMSTFSIHHLTARTKLTQFQKVKDQIDTFEKSGTKLTFNVKVKEQIRSLSNFLLCNYMHA